MRRRRCSRRGHRFPRRLFWRIYLFGLALLSSVALLLAVSAHLAFGKSAPWLSPSPIGRYIDLELSPLIDRPAELGLRLDRLHRVFGLDLAVYRADGERVASAGAPPEPLSAAPERLRLRRRHGFTTVAVPLAGGAYAIGRSRFAAPRFSAALLLMGVVLLLVQFLSVPLARTIARPIERVTKAAQALGAGDLSARTGVVRADEVGDLARAFDDMAERLERLVESERELLANVSHELRTPLARIRVALELAEEDADSGARHLAGICGDLRELEELVDNVLSAARLDLAAGREGRLAIDRRDVALAELVAAAAERYRARCPDAVIAVEAAADAPRISGDAALLRRALDNLLDNAAKHAGLNSGAIEVACRRSADTASIAVRDHGPGVPEADLSRLFEPFFRSDRSRERSTGGVGLGLALCRRIVEAHGGTIDADLPEGGGLRVSIRLPLAG